MENLETVANLSTRDVNGLINAMTDMSEACQVLVEKDRHKGKMGRTMLYTRIKDSASSEVKKLQQTWDLGTVVGYCTELRSFVRVAQTYERIAGKWA